MSLAAAADEEDDCCEFGLGEFVVVVSGLGLVVGDLTTRNKKRRREIRSTVVDLYGTDRQAKGHGVVRSCRVSVWLGLMACGWCVAAVHVYIYLG